MMISFAVSTIVAIAVIILVCKWMAHRNCFTRRRRNLLIIWCAYALIVFTITLGCRAPKDYFRISFSIKPYFDMENILLFVPFGFLLGITAKPRWPWFILSAIVSSLLIEILQLFTKLGYFELMDIIFNTVGSCIGYMFFLAIVKIYQAHNKR